MSDTDVIVVGFRCAGAGLALDLHRAGVRVIALEKDPLYGDQPFSTHVIQPYGMKMLDRLGLGDRVRELAPPVSSFRLQLEGHRLQLDFDGTEHDSRCPRRSVLDPALQRAVIGAGVEVRAGSSVVGLLRDGERVSGVRVRGPQGEYDLRASLVVGADGRNSAIARLAQAPAYVEGSSPNALVWAYFEASHRLHDDPRYGFGACIHLEGEEACAIFRSDSGLVLMAAGGRRKQVQGWRGDLAGNLEQRLRAGSLSGPLLEGSRRVSEPVAMLALHYHMKQAAGPGWALVGDAGLHKDPTPGLGITDALRDALALSQAIQQGSEQALLCYWRRRDLQSIGLYHMAADMGSDHYNCGFNRMLFDRVQASDALRGRLMEVMERKLEPQQMVPSLRLIGWLLGRSLRGDLDVWQGFGATLGTARRIETQQKILARALARAESGVIDYRPPALA